MLLYARLCRKLLSLARYLTGGQITQLQLHTIGLVDVAAYSCMATRIWLHAGPQPKLHFTVIDDGHLGPTRHETVRYWHFHPH